MSALDNPNGGNAHSWRYRCPNGHTGYRTSGNQYICETCRKYNTDDPYFQTPIDAKTGEEVAK